MTPFVIPSWTGKTWLKRPDGNINDKLSRVFKESLFIRIVTTIIIITAVNCDRFLTRIITFNSTIVWGAILSYLKDKVIESQRGPVTNTVTQIIIRWVQDLNADLSKLSWDNLAVFLSFFMLPFFPFLQRYR